jgi:plasmid maintenance system antidote protein VapI
MAKFNFTTPGGRLKFLINNLNLDQANFAKQLKRSRADICRFVNNKAPLNKNLLNDVKNAFPNINIEWLSNNIGTSGIDTEIRLNRENEYLSIISDLRSKIEQLQIENNQLKQRQQ